MKYLQMEHDAMVEMNDQMMGLEYIIVVGGHTHLSAARHKAIVHVVDEETITLQSVRQTHVLQTGSQQCTGVVH